MNAANFEEDYIYIDLMSEYWLILTQRVINNL